MIRPRFKDFIPRTTKTVLRVGVSLTFLFVAGAQQESDREIHIIQDEIARVDGPDGYYNRTYRKFGPLYWQKIPAWMRQDARREKASRILDIGCGYGTLLALAAEIYGARGYCMDVTEYLKPAFARGRNLMFVRGNIELNPIPWHDKFDIVILTEVLEHFNFQPLPTLRKIHAGMRVGGVLYLSTPDEREWGRLHTYYRRLSDLPAPDPALPIRDAHIWIYSKREISTLLDQAGFNIARFDYARGNGNRHFNVEAISR